MNFVGQMLPQIQRAQDVWYFLLELLFEHDSGAYSEASFIELLFVIIVIHNLNAQFLDMSWFSCSMLPFGWCLKREFFHVSVSPTIFTSEASFIELWL